MQPVINNWNNLKLLIKNMVSLRCKLIVKSELEKLNIKPFIVDLGEVETEGKLSQEKYTKLKTNLLAFGLELMDDKKSILIEKIKNIIVEMIHYNEELPAVNFSNFLSE